MTPDTLIGESAGIVSIREKLTRLIDAAATFHRAPAILLCGETGTGKGLVARSIHDAGRPQGPFVDLDCAAIPETLLEAELFGVERGAFTDAKQTKPGLFRAAHGGTLFLDEIGLLPKGLQGKLLKSLESRSVRRLGATRAEAVDAWIVAATNEDLAGAVKEGRFRPDLYHRLAGITLTLPPLRARSHDILLLADRFLHTTCTAYALSKKTLGADAQAALLSHSWPGNVRKLANVIERAALLSAGPVIDPLALSLPEPERLGSRLSVPGGAAAPPIKESISSFERAQLLEAPRGADGNVARAARHLGLPRTTLRYRMIRLGLIDDSGSLLENRASAHDRSGSCRHCLAHEPD